MAATFSKSLENELKREIGRKFVKRSLSPFLKIGLTSAVFRQDGINPVLKDRFNKWVKGSKMDGAINFSQLVDIPSGPQLFLFFNFRKSPLIIV